MADGFRITSFEASSSTWPELRFAFTVPGGARPQLALHLDAELAAEVLRRLECLGRVRIEDDLEQPRAIAQVDEDHAAVVAATMHPAGRLDGAAREGLVDFSAVVCAHGQGARCYVPGGGRGNRG